MFAGSVKIDPVCVDRSFAAGSCGIHHGIDISHAWKIVNALTAGADEVMMPLYICIKPVGSFARGDLHDLTHFSEESKIPVDCAETDIRILLTEAGIDRVGSGMIGTTGQKLMIASRCLLYFLCIHCISLIIIIVTVINITEEVSHVK